MASELLGDGHDGVNLRVLRRCHADLLEGVSVGDLDGGRNGIQVKASQAPVDHGDEHEGPNADEDEGHKPYDNDMPLSWSHFEPFVEA